MIGRDRVGGGKFCKRNRLRWGRAVVYNNGGRLDYGYCYAGDQDGVVNHNYL